MTTSNKLLTGLLVLVLLAVTGFMAVAKYYQKAGTVSGSGTQVSQARQVEAFEGIEAKGNIEITITQEPGHKLEITADTQVLTLVTSRVQDGILHLEVDAQVDREEKIQAKVSLDSLQSLVLTRGAKATTPHDIRGSNLSVNMSTGSNADLAVQYNSLEYNASTGAVLHLRGAVENATLQGTTGSVIKAEDLTAKKYTVQENAGTTATIRVLNELTADVSTGSTLTYFGEPTVRNVHSYTGGVIEKK